MCVALSVLELLCRPGWPKTCRDLTVSASQVLELKARHHCPLRVYSQFSKERIYHSKPHAAVVCTLKLSRILASTWFILLASENRLIK